MSVNTLNANTIKQIPVVFGEADLVKTITLLPGISSGGEGTAGFNVRGGSNDQNLILLDEATLFNSSHLFGFFSVFNPDAIKHKKLKVITKDNIYNSFGRKDLLIFTNSQKLKEFLKAIDWKNSNLLMMSSGDFNGIKLENIF